MSHIYVCLVSDQTIPNILGIHHFSPDELLFITTEDMERKGKVSSILKTLDRLGMKYENRLAKIIVKEDSILDTHRKIENWIQDKEDSDFSVNITCGTKIMSIAVYEYFKDYSSKMIYIPLPKNEFIVPFPKKSPGKPIPLNLRLGVIDYLIAYGQNVTNEEKIASYKEDVIKKKDLSYWMIENYEDLKNLLTFLSGSLRLYRNKKEFILKTEFGGATESEKELLKRLDFKYVNKNISKKLTRSEIRFLTGGWLEEFCFNKVYEFEGSDIDDVVLGLRLKNPNGGENEFDVMFTKENVLYFIECKSLDQDDDKNTEILYKIGALQKEFGLKVRSFLVTTSPYILKNGRLRESVNARAEQFNTEVIIPSDVKNIGKILAQRLK